MSLFRKIAQNSWLIPVGLILLNFVLKILFLSSRDIALDEPFTIYYSQADLSSLFQMLKTENNPPLFFILTHYWIAAFGISAFSVRFLPLLFSTLTAPVIYLTGKRYFSERSGILASLFFTFSDYHLLFSHEARVYPLFALLTGLSMYFYLSLIRDPRRRMPFYLLVLSDVLLIYAHFFGFFVIGIQVLCIIVYKDVRKAAKILILPVGIALCFYLPYFPVLFHRFTASSGGTWVSPPVITDLYNMVWKFCNAPVVTVFFLAVLVTGLVKYTLMRKNPVKCLSPYQKVLLNWFFVPFFFIFLVSFKMPMFLDRYLVFTSIAFYLLVSNAIVFTSGGRRVVFYTLAVIAVGGMLLTFHPNVDNRRELKKVVATIKELRQNNIPVLICPEWTELGFTYYYSQPIFKNYGKLRQGLQKEMIFPLNHQGQLPMEVLERSDTIILLEEWPEVVDKNNDVFKTVSGKYNNCRKISIPEVYEIYCFTRRK